MEDGSDLKTGEAEGMRSIEWCKSPEWGTHPRASLVLQVDDAAAESRRHGGDPVSDLQLREDVLGVRVHGLIADRQGQRDFAVRQPLCHQVEDFHLPTRERRAARAIREARGNF